MIVVGHRGANKEALENSWAAYELAIEGGAHRIELDVHLTADNEVVIMHDLELFRTTGKHGNLGMMTRAEVQTRKLLNGESIPFLDEVLTKIYPRCEINIEIKGSSELLAQKVAELLYKFSAVDRIIVSCFSVEPLQYFARHFADVKRACLWGDWPAWPSFADFCPILMMKNCRASILHPVAFWVTENLMDQSRARGWTVYPYVTMKGEDRDRVGLWSTMTALGVDGLCTNFPRELAMWLVDVRTSEARAQSLSLGLK